MDSIEVLLATIISKNEELLASIQKDELDSNFIFQLAKFFSTISNRVLVPHLEDRPSCIELIQKFYIFGKSIFE
jgi:hypothetical protein